MSTLILPFSCATSIALLLSPFTAPNSYMPKSLDKIDLFPLPVEVVESPIVAQPGTEFLQYKFCIVLHGDFGVCEFGGACVRVVLRIDVRERGNKIWP